MRGFCSPHHGKKGHRALSEHAKQTDLSEGALNRGVDNRILCALHALLYTESGKDPFRTPLESKPNP